MAQVQYADRTTTEDLAYACRSIVAGSIAVTTGRMDLESPAETVMRIQSGDMDAIEHLRHELAGQIAWLIVRADDSVRSVFLEHNVPEAEEMEPPEVGLSDVIRLVVYSERKTAALGSLLDALDQALVDAMSEHVGRLSPGFVQAEIVDREEARRIRSGLRGFRPSPMWLASREE